MRSTESAPSIPVKESTGIRTDLKTIFVVLGIVVAATAAVTVLRATNAGQGEKLNQTEAIMRADHDSIVTHTAQIQGIVKTLENMDKKLDYLTGASNARPAAGAK